MLKPETKKQLEKLLEPLDSKELLDIYEIWKQFSDHRDRLEALSFKMGDTVSFMARGRILTGKVTGIGGKTVRVQTEDWPAPGKWRVAPSLLTKIPKGGKP